MELMDWVLAALSLGWVVWFLLMCIGAVPRTVVPDHGSLTVGFLDCTPAASPPTPEVVGYRDPARAPAPEREIEFEITTQQDFYEDRCLASGRDRKYRRLALKRLRRRQADYEKAYEHWRAFGAVTGAPEPLEPAYEDILAEITMRYEYV